MEEASSVEKITSKIIEDAEKTSDEIIAEAKRLSQERKDAAKRKGEAEKKRILEDANKKADQTKRKLISEAMIKARTAVLESKEKLIQEAFEKASEELGKIPEKKGYRESLRRLATDTCIELGGGNLELVVRKKDENILKADLKKMEKDVKSSTGVDTKLKLSSEVIGAGVIVRRSDKGVEIDSTIGNRLELLTPELRIKLAEVLFK